MSERVTPEQLRKRARSRRSWGVMTYEDRQMILKAADTIEELTREVAALRDPRWAPPSWKRIVTIDDGKV